MHRYERTAFGIDNLTLVERAQEVGEEYGRTATSGVVRRAVDCGSG